MILKLFHPLSKAYSFDILSLTNIELNITLLDFVHILAITINSTSLISKLRRSNEHLVGQKKQYMEKTLTIKLQILSFVRYTNFYRFRLSLKNARKCSYPVKFFKNKNCEFHWVPWKNLLYIVTITGRNDVTSWAATVWNVSNYGVFLVRIFPHSVQMRKNTDQKNSIVG